MKKEKRRRHCLLALGAALAGAVAMPSQAAALRLCDAPTAASAEEQDRTLRLAALVKAELERSGVSVALVARSGVDLARFGFRTSHAGIALKASRNGAWSVRQLYYVCDEARPRLFDQGMAGFLLGSEAGVDHVSIVLLPDRAGAALERAALDDRLAGRLLGARYSANAYPFGLEYQNCNQWVVEMLAASWGRPAGDVSSDGMSREQAQRWLRAQGYAPSVFEVGNPTLMWLAGFATLLHDDDHPADDLAGLRYRVSMPAAIEAFVAAKVPDAQRVEVCRSGRQAVIHRGWDAMAEGCRPGVDDTVVALD